MAVVIMLSINLILETHHSINGSFVWTTGKWPFAPWTLAAGLINVSLASVGAIWLGFPGLVLGSLIAKLVTLNWYVVYFTLKRLTIQWREYRRGILVPILWSVLLTLAATLGVRLLIDPIQTWAVLYYGARVGGLLVLAAAGMITLVIGSGCFYFIVFSPFERGFIKARFVRN